MPLSREPMSFRKPYARPLRSPKRKSRGRRIWNCLKTFAEQSIADEDALRPLAVQAPVMPEPSASQVQRAVRAISGAKRPVILAGNGVIRRNASEVVRSFARAFQIPVLQTFMAKGVMPDSDPLSLHTLGLIARDYAALVMEQADVVLRAIGYDFVEYAPCFWNPRRDKHIVHVDGLPGPRWTHITSSMWESWVICACRCR